MELAEVEARIGSMMVERALSSFPSHAELAGESADLYESVMRLGGRFFCAKSMGVRFESRRAQSGTWDLDSIRAKFDEI